MKFSEVLNIATAIIASLGGGALLVVTFSGWLGKIWANRIMQEDISKHQHDLEEIKNKLKKLEIEHNVVFSELHKRRADVVEKLYHLIIDTMLFLGSLLATKNWPSEKSKQGETQKAFNQFRELLYYFNKYKIYLDKDLSEYINKFLYQLNIDRKSYTIHSNNMEIDITSLEECRKSWESFNANALKTVEKLEDEFRKLIGVKV